MSWALQALEALELDQDADERAIKRAYARLLRSNRPDDDPEAFQQLNEAYKTALNWAQSRPSQDQETADEQPLSAMACEAGPAPLEAALASLTDSAPSANSVSEGVPREVVAPAPSVRPAWNDEERAPEPSPPPPFASPSDFSTPPALPVQWDMPVPLDVDRLCEIIIERAHTSAPADFGNWLNTLPELWSLRDKSQVGTTLKWKLFAGEHAIRESNFDVIAHYFCWDEISSGPDPFDAAHCRHRLHHRWMLQPYGQVDLARYLRSNGLNFSADQAHRYLQYLRRPWRPMQSLCTATPLWRTFRMNLLLEKLQIDDDRHAPSALIPEQIAFWLAASSYEMSAQRFMLSSLRGAAAGLSLLVMAVMLWVVTSLLLPSTISTPLSGFLKVGLWGAGALFAAGALLPLWQALIRWISADEDALLPHPILRLWLIPLLAIASVALIHLADQRAAGSVLAWLALSLAATRLWRRGRHAWGLNLGIRGWLFAIFFLAVPAAKLLFFMIIFGEIGAAAAVLLWLRDAWLRVRKTR